MESHKKTLEDHFKSILSNANEGKDIDINAMNETVKSVFDNIAKEATEKDNAFQKEMEDLKTEKAAADDNLATATSEIENLKTEVTDLKASNSAKDEELETLATEKTGLETKVENLTAANAELAKKTNTPTVETPPPGVKPQTTSTPNKSVREEYEEERNSHIPE